MEDEGTATDAVVKVGDTDCLHSLQSLPLAAEAYVGGADLSRPVSDCMLETQKKDHVMVSALVFVTVLNF